MIQHEIHGKQAVMGLTWKAGGLDDQIEVPPDHFVVSIRNEVTGHQYIGYTGQTPDKHAVSAAAWLARSVDRPTIVVAKLDEDLYWMVIAMPNGLDYQTDIAGSADDLVEVLQVVLEDYDAGSLQAFQLDADVVTGYYLPDAQELESLDGLFDANINVRQIRLKSNRVLQLPWKTIAAVSVAALVVYGSWYGWQRYQYMKELDRLRQQAAQKASSNNKPAPDLKSLREARIAEAVSKALEQDLATPEPMSVIQACTQAWLSAGQRNGGWEMKQATCQGNALNLQWSRQTGQLANVRTFAGEASVSSDGKTLTSKLTIDSTKPRVAPARDELPDWNAVAHSLIADLQEQERLDVVFSTTSLAPRSIQYEDPDIQITRSNPDNKTDVPPAQGYNQATVTVKGESLWRLQQIPIQWDWASVQQVVFKSDGKWEVTLKINVR